MGTFLRIIIFGGCAISFSVYAYRGYRRWIAPDRDDAGAASGLGRPASGSTASTTGPTPSGAAPAPGKTPERKRSFGFTDPYDVPSERASTESESLVQAVIREELARKQGAPSTGSESGAAAASGPTPGRSGLFAGGSERSDDRVSVATALTGIRLPEDLVPFVGDADQADPHHVTFLSTTTGAADLGRQIADDLERLGFEVGSESDQVAVATKGAVTLRVALFPDAANERRDGTRRFPTAPPRSVVVEFST